MEQLKITKLNRIGDSLGIIIPKNILSALKWERGDQVVFGIFNDDTVAVRKITNEEIKTWKI